MQIGHCIVPQRLIAIQISMIPLMKLEDILDQHGYIDTNVKWEKEDTLPRGVGYPAKSGSLLLKDTQNSKRVRKSLYRLR